MLQYFFDVKNKGVRLFCIMLLMAPTVFAQKLGYDLAYFRYPMSIPIALAANFGELRTNHFHMGLDMRTQQRENIPILAAADGYVSRVFISSYGYGNMLVIRHDNGLETLYAHLNDFYPALQQYVGRKQYKDKSWVQDFQLPAGLFPVKKGMFIAYSGNTGGSQGPHLHFEIRNPQNGMALNPMLFGLGITDKLPPMLYGVYYYDRRQSIYATTAISIPLVKKSTTSWITNGVVKVGTPLLSMGFAGEDKTDAHSFKFGIYKAILRLDGQEKNKFELNELPLAEQRYLNAAIDYSRKMKGGNYIQHLSTLKGNQLSCFKGDGLIDLSDGKPHVLQLILSDTKGNTTQVMMQLQYDIALDKHSSTTKKSNVHPLQPTVLETINAEFIASPKAFYDDFYFDMKESPATKSIQVSPTIHLHHYTVPIHDEYSIAIKAQNLYKQDKIVTQLVSGSYSAVAKGMWDKDKMVVHFNRLGNVSLVRDEEPPTIAIGRVPATVTNGKKITVSVNDNLKSIHHLRGTVNQQWLCFVRKGNTFIYTVDDYLPLGVHTLRLEAEDIAGNKTIKEITITKI